MTSTQVIEQLRSMANSDNVAGMKRFGIRGSEILGISMADLRKLARPLSPSHDLALELWETGIHEARLLATLVEDPAAVDGKQMDAWVEDIESWDLCDQCCINVFRFTDEALGKVYEWAKRDEEFVKRAGYSLLATLAVKPKHLPNSVFVEAFPLIIEGAKDDRNFVKKSVNWALRQIGKRNREIHPLALEVAKELTASSNRAERWVGKDALRELSSEKTIARLK